LLHPPEIDYSIVVRPRRKTVGIVVRASGHVEVLAPPRLPTAEIERLIREKAGWIRKKLQLHAEAQASHQPKVFNDGETFSLAGKSLTLRIEAGRRSTSVEGDRLVARLPSYEPARRERLVRRQLIDWYKQQALAHFGKRAAHFAAIIGKHPKQLTIKGYKSRWGSCHRDGRICFNWRLAMAPPSVIDYVVVHELCHLVHHNHSPAYWRLIESVLPEYRQARQWLKLNSLSLDL